MIDDADESHERQDSDYDGAWKEALRLHLPQFVGRFFPSLAQSIDWSCDPVWLDKEISQIIGQAGQRNQEVDLLFKVLLRDGKEQWILCHLEIQTAFQSDFEQRLDLYNAGLKWTFRQEVITLVILADINPRWRPREHRFELGGFVSYRLFPVCKVIDHLESDWADDTSLAVQVARAQIAALRTAGNPEERFHAKTQLIRNLYSVGYNAGEIRELYRLIDWMMHLRPDLTRQFELDLVSFEKELQMPYITSIERHAEERGLEKGLEQGRAILVRQLSRLCGDIPVDVLLQVKQLSFEQAEDLGIALLDFRSVADLKTWLEAHAVDPS
ncbi:DUF4351 domain-containing protein [Schlesneria sp.]|uniref:DUF4351 domain-containing protein n=1 Tax=Schlesneria sp. TaxID=2762018 RepID=UPI002EFE75AE